MGFYAYVLFVAFLAAKANCLGDFKLVSVDNGNGRATTFKEYETDPTIGNTANSVISLLTKREGWVADDPSVSVASARSGDDLSSSGSEYYPAAVNTGFTVGVHKPQLEILKLVETFVKFKGEVIPKLYAILVDNSDLLKSFIYFAVNNIGHLHSFTLNGIVILRQILQFAADLFGHWGLPSLTVALNKAITPESYSHNSDYHAEGYYGGGGGYY